MCGGTGLPLFSESLSGAYRAVRAVQFCAGELGHPSIHGLIKARQSGQVTFDMSSLTCALSASHSGVLSGAAAWVW